MLCNTGPEGEFRNFTKNHRGVDPELYCKHSWDSKEADILFVKHNHNVSSLAESLCSQDHEKSSEAREHMSHIGLLKESMHDWLVETKWLTESNKPACTPLVLETGFNFHEQIRDVMRWLLVNRTGMENSEDFEAREQNSRLRDCMDKANNHKGLARHSSVVRYPLSSAGVECLARFYRKDYEVIRHLASEGWCKTSGCQPALQAILNRREHLLAF